MTVRPEPYRFTVDEYHRMAEAGLLGEDERVELIGGEIIAMAADGKPPCRLCCAPDASVLPSRKRQRHRVGAERGEARRPPRCSPASPSCQEGLLCLRSPHRSRRPAHPSRSQRRPRPTTAE